MNRTSNPIVLFGAALLAMLAGFGAVIGLLVSRPVQAQSTGTVAPQITVIGSGTIEATPDTATVNIGVETNAPSTQEALNQNNQQTQAVIDQIKNLGVDEKDIQTSGFNIYPTYNTDGQQITGYNVSNTVTVKIRDLANAGTLLDQVVSAGANRIYGISFSVDDPTALYDQAREAAVAEARARAEKMAKAAGVSVGKVLVITESLGSTPVVMPIAAGMMADASKVALQPGSSSFTAQVQVTFELR